MELINPRVTVQNTNSESWLVRIEHRFSEHEYLDCMLRVDRGDLTLPELEAMTLQKLVMLAEAMTPPNRRTG